MGLMDRILTAIPDSGWRQAAHERHSPSFDDEFYRRSREQRDAGSGFSAPVEPLRPRSSWHERFGPGDEYAQRPELPAAREEFDTAEPAGGQDYDAPDYGVNDCPASEYSSQNHPGWEDYPGSESDAPAIEPELEPVAAYFSGSVRTGDPLDDPLGVGESSGPAPLISRPAPLESEIEYFPELYPLGNGMAIDPDGFLTDVDGHYLRGLPLDPLSGLRRSDAPSFICVEHSFLPAKATREVRYQVNLPARPMTATSDDMVPGSELLDLRAFSRNPSASGFGVVAAEDAQRFIARSVSGGSVTVYDPTGSAMTMRLRWAKIASVAVGGADRWNLFYLACADALGREIAWRNVGLDYTFGADGRLNPALPRVTLTNVVIDGLRIGDVTLVHGRDGVTQFAGRHGVVNVRGISQDGYVAGDFVGLDLTDEGMLSARYSNGRKLALAEGVFASTEMPMTADPEMLRAAARLMREQLEQDEESRAGYEQRAA